MLKYNTGPDTTANDGDLDPVQFGKMARHRSAREIKRKEQSAPLHPPVQWMLPRSVRGTALEM